MERTNIFHKYAWNSYMDDVMNIVIFLERVSLIKRVLRSLDSPYLFLQCQLQLREDTLRSRRDFLLKL